MRTALLVTAAACGLARAGDRPATEPDIPALVRQLASPAFADREAATQALAGTPSALPALRAATADKNPEVARRAADAVRTLTRRLGADRLKQLPAYAEARQVDRIVEAMAAWPEAVSMADRELPRTLAKGALAWAAAGFGPGLPEVKVLGLNRWDRDAAAIRHGKLFVDYWRPDVDVVAGAVDQMRLRPGGGFVAAGSFLSAGDTRWANADLRLVGPDRGRTGFAGLLVCNGDVSAEQRTLVTDGVILCTGDVRIAHQLERSLVVAGGNITFDSPAMEKLAGQNGAILRPREPKLAEFLKFYDSAAEGLHVRAEDKAVSVTKVDPGKPFAAAGLQPGDRILRVGGDPVRSARELNRLLCRAEVGYPGTAALALARGDKAVDVVVKLNDLPTLTP